MLKNLAAISLAAAVLVLAAPAAATAAPSAPPESDSYAGTPRAGIANPMIDTCSTSTVTFGAGYFEPSEAVAVSVAGLDAESATLSGNTAAADGSMVVAFTPPSNGKGTYPVRFSGSRSYTATILVADGGSTATNCASSTRVAAVQPRSTDTGALATTGGGEVSPWLVGGGALALVAGGGLIIGASRRTRQG